MLFVFITIVLLIIVVAVLWIWYLVHTFQPDPVVNVYADIRPRLQTGDIIMFSRSKHSSVLEKLIYLSRTRAIGYEYGHVGLVYKDRKTGKLYMIECVSPSSVADEYAITRPNSCARIVDLDVLLSTYQSERGATFCVKFISKAIDNTCINQSISKYVDNTFEKWPIMFGLAAVDLLVSTDISKTLSTRLNRSDSLMCSEFVYRLLADCGTVDDKLDAELFWPHRFVDGTFDKLSRVKYSKCHTFIV